MGRTERIAYDYLNYNIHFYSIFLFLVIYRFSILLSFPVFVGLFFFFVLSAFSFLLKKKGKSVESTISISWISDSNAFII